MNSDKTYIELPLPPSSTRQFNDQQQEWYDVHNQSPENVVIQLPYSHDIKQQQELYDTYKNQSPGEEKSTLIESPILAHSPTLQPLRFLGVEDGDNTSDEDSSECESCEEERKEYSPTTPHFIGKEQKEIIRIVKDLVNDRKKIKNTKSRRLVDNESKIKTLIPDITRYPHPKTLQ